MFKKLFSIIAIAAVTAFAFSACEPDEPMDNTVALEGITVSPDSLALEVGQTGTLAVAYVPTDASVKPEIIWATSNPAVATVEDGTVTAVGEGKAEIIAKADKFTAKSVVTVTKPATPGPGPGPEPQPEDKWDYTPGEAYAAATNLWKPVADAGAEKFFYYLSTGDQWNGTPTEAAEVPFITKKESTYKIHYDDATYGGIWHNQVFIFSDEDHLIALNPAKKYQLKVTMGATKACPAFLKLSTYKKAADFLETDTDEAKAKHEGITIWEKGEFSLSADAPVAVESDEFYGIEANGINMIMAFGNNPDSVDIYVKDVILVEVGDAPVTPDPEPEDTWDYTPGENYLAANNLWKPVFDANKEFVYGQITGYASMDIEEIAGLTKNKSTYKFHFNGATTGDWSNCNFIVPDADHKVALSAGKNYMIEYVLGATKDLPRAFIKINKDDPTKDNHEGAYIIDRVDPVTAGTPLAVSYEFNGADCDNISFTIDFGGNPEQVDIYIKDLTIYEVVPQTLKFELKSDEEANMTAAADAAGAAIWHIEADKGVDFDAVVKLNGVETTTGVTVEKYEAGGGHIAINYAALTDEKSAEIWTVKVTTANDKVENKEINLSLLHGTYMYTSLEYLNADIIAAGDKEVVRIVDLSSKVEISKIDGDYVYAQNSTGGVTLYKTGLESKGMGTGNTIAGKFVVSTKCYKGLPEVTAILNQSADANIGGWAGTNICFNVNSIADLIASFPKYVGAKCKLTKPIVVTTAFSNKAKNGAITDASGDAPGTIALYWKSDDSIDAPVGTKANWAAGWVTVYNNTKQISIYKIGGFDVASYPGVITMPETKILGIGDTFDLEATTNSTATITYVSSNTDVATVSEAGLVTAVAAGEATITASVAKAGKYEAGEAKCVVTVTAGEVPVDPYSIDLAYTLGSNAYDDGVATINGTANVKVLKIGTSSNPGSLTVTIPAGTKKVTYYAVGWKGTNPTLDFKIGGTSVLTQAIAGNDGATSSSPFTITVTDSDKYQIVNDFAAETVVTVTTTAKARAILWGFKAE